MTKQPEEWTPLKIIAWTKGYLAEKGVENARLEAEWLLASALGLDRVGLYVNFDKPLTAEELAAIRGLVARRARREPLQYILGTQEFMGLEFVVTPAVLIPRHDTETLVNEALKRCPETGRVLDIGVGSGCVAVSLAKSMPLADVHGVELSTAAIEVAKQNAARNGVAVHVLSGSLFEPFAGEKFDLIVANPPYIPTADLDTLQPEVREFEPRGALDGGLDGLDYYRRIIPSAPEYLAPGGWLLVEVGIKQAAEVLELFVSAGFVDCFIAKDPGGIDRVVGGRFP